MREAQSDALRGRRVLVVEDNYMIASDLARTLEEHGAEAAGPAGSVAEALALIASEGDRLDGAALDINLGEERAYPIADALAARGVPFVFASGYDDWTIPAAYAHVPRCEKPVDTAAIIRMLERR